MEHTSAWNSLEIANLLVSILTPIVIVFLGFLFNRYLHKVESKREDQIRAQDAKEKQLQSERDAERHKQEAKEREERDELTRRHYPHIEFDIDCHILGPYQDKYAAEFILSADNMGITKHEFKSIKLVVRGILRGTDLTFWESRYKNRLEFPEKILEDEVVAKDLNFIFVEPGVKQRISYITIIDKQYKIIKANAEFYYEEYRPHSAEKMFEVAPQVPIITQVEMSD